METTEQVIRQTKKWITDVVAGCNFCPFAAKELKQNTIHYQVEEAVDLAGCLEAFLKECVRLAEEEIETSLLIFSNGFRAFDDYLELAVLAEKLLKQEGYEGIYQVAGFHPLYIFAGAPIDDAANYTNRSVYPMLHLLREDSIERALSTYPNPEQIPERNILFARAKGTAYMKMLRDSCL
ncbi:MAG: DUF1415 domain-containing protein [Chitinophagaceae bacterium]